MSIDTNKKKSLPERFDIDLQRERLKALQGEMNLSTSPLVTDEEVTPYTLSYPEVSLDDDIILAASTRLQLHEGIAKIRFHKKIYEEWNFGSVDKQGKSVILNFYGVPGTGKTLTAEAFAGTLKHPIIKLGIAELESKFMGETSKNIQAVFKLAAEKSAVLFFDEADTLLGKRLSSVTQGIDNEVNAMRSTLLIELEKFDGIVIFATNFAKNYDEAFRSRISHHVLFELPDEECRKALWSKMLVSEIPLHEEREEFINVTAKLSEGFSGREIRTCMRLSLPKAILDAEKNDQQAILKLEHLKEVIEQVKQAKKDIANTGGSMSSADRSAAKSLLGLNN